MTVRIFIRFHAEHVPCDTSVNFMARVHLLADIACKKAIKRDFDFFRDYVHIEGAAVQPQGLCHVLIDCDYEAHEPDTTDCTVHAYRVKPAREGEDSLYVTLFLCRNSSCHVCIRPRQADFSVGSRLKHMYVPRGPVDEVPWGNDDHLPRLDLENELVLRWQKLRCVLNCFHRSDQSPNKEEESAAPTAS